MNTRILFFGSLLILLTSCSAKDATDDILPRQEIFSKKIECSKYVEIAEKKAAEYGKLLAGETDISFPNMERVFYSPKVNSCLFVWSNNLVFFENSVPKHRGDRGLNDVLTGEELLRSIYIEGDPILGAGSEWNKDEEFSKM